ncbi:MAG: nitronate monooxygenase, partial [Parasphingorhabdus sp.]
MTNKICDLLGIEFPLLAFSHCRDVVAAVSRAGGMGVFGGVNCSPEMLEEELSWIDAHVDGKPYGLDIIVPNKVEGKGESPDPEAVLASIPEEHKQFTNEILERHGVDSERSAGDIEAVRLEQVASTENLRGGTAAAILEVAFRHPIGLVANALGIPPQVMLDLGQKHNVPVAALVGTKEHAMTQVAAGVDIIVAVGGEAGGHTGDISTLVLIPEICNMLDAIGDDTPVLAAGGIATGAQM